MTAAGRRWLELSVRLPAEPARAELLADALLTMGGRAIEERAGWQVTHLLPDDLSPGDDEARARWHRRTSDALLAATGLDDLELRTRWCDDEDWAESWKRGLGVRAVTDRITVRPTWLPAPEPSPEVLITLDPGMAFGTAEHGTTRGCLRLLETALSPGDCVLDVGSGSGILAIAAAKLGAESVVAIEGDSLACEALHENLEANRVGDRVGCVEGLVDADDLAARGPVDGVVANIESLTLQRLMTGFSRAVRPGGWLVLSGIQTTEWERMHSVAEEAGFRLEEIDTDGEWSSGRFVRGGG